MVTDDGLKKFGELYLKRYGIELSPKELFDKANQLLNFYRAVFREPADIKIKINYGQEVQTKKN
jgi:hypothetical protein